MDFACPCRNIRQLYIINESDRRSVPSRKITVAHELCVCLTKCARWHVPRMGNSLILQQCICFAVTVIQISRSANTKLTAHLTVSVGQSMADRDSRLILQNMPASFTILHSTQHALQGCNACIRAYCQPQQSQWQKSCDHNQTGALKCGPVVSPRAATMSALAGLHVDRVQVADKAAMNMIRQAQPAECHLLAESCSS